MAKSLTELEETEVEVDTEADDVLWEVIEVVEGETESDSMGKVGTSAPAPATGPRTLVGVSWGNGERFLISRLRLTWSGC